MPKTTRNDAVGHPVKVTDALGRMTRTEYDALGQVVKVIEPDSTADLTDNPVVRTFYTHHGKPWKVIDQNGRETTSTYDAAGRVVQVASPLLQVSSSPSLQAQAITTTEYDLAGNVKKVTDPRGKETNTVYDSMNRPVTITAPAVMDALTNTLKHPVTQTTYDNLGQVLTVTDPLGHVTTKHYDNAGRNWKVEAPAVWSAPSSVRPTTVTKFDAGGLPLTVTNPLGQTVTNTYDTHGRLITTEDAEHITNHFEYDEAGNRTKVKDGKNQVTSFVYDGLNRLTLQTFANGDTWTYEYNALHKLAQTSPRGIVTSYTYDARDRVLTTSAQGAGVANSRSYTYDPAGHLLTVEEPGSTADVSYVYDALGRVTAESSRGQTHFYEYDLAGNRTKATYSTGRVVQTSYDALNRPETISEGGRLTRYGYDLGGRAVIQVGGNGQVSNNTYDALGRLEDRTLYKTAAMTEADVLAEFSWEHDLLGNVTAQHETWPGSTQRQGGIRSTRMTYDADNRLRSETIQTSSSGAAEPQDQSITSYTYDAANNRKTKTVTRIAGTSTEAGENEIGHWTYTYNNANQLTSWEKWDEPSGSVQKSASLSYDEAGNRTSQSIQGVGVANSQATGTTSYAWDAQDRLASVTMPDGSVHSYAYDYRTRRIETRSGGSLPPTSTAIVFAGGLSVAEYDVSASASSSIENPASSIVQYVRGPDMGGGVGGMLYSLRGGVTKYSLSNGRGDIVAQADQSATLTWTASYEAYGKRTKETGTNLDKQRANSKDEDPTAMLNEGQRYRDIETGVWMSRDPAGFVDGPNLYAYVKQNPWTGWDPHGLSVEVKRTPKPPPATANMTTTSRKAAEKRQAQEGFARGQNSHTEIHMKAVLLDATTKGMSDKEIKALQTAIVDSVTRQWSGEDKDTNQSWKMTMDLKIVKSAKDVQADDHLFVIHDVLLTKGGGAVPEYGGYTMPPKGQNPLKGGSIQGFGGNDILLSQKSLMHSDGTLRDFAKWLPGHEVGHSMGERHPHDPWNSIRGTFRGFDNVMTTPPVVEGYAKSARQQIDHIYENSIKGNLNQGHTAIDTNSWFETWAMMRRD